MQESVRIDTGGDGKTVRGDNAGGQQVGERNHQSGYSAAGSDRKAFSYIG